MHSAFDVQYGLVVVVVVVVVGVVVVVVVVVGGLIIHVGIEKHVPLYVDMLQLDGNPTFG